MFVRFFKALNRLKIDWYTAPKSKASAVFGVIGDGRKAERRYGIISIPNGVLKLMVFNVNTQEFSKSISALFGRTSDSKNDEFETGLDDEKIKALEAIVNKEEKWEVGDGKFLSFTNEVTKKAMNKTEIKKKQGENIPPSRPAMEIYYGPPGTGKTKELISKINAMYKDNSEGKDISGDEKRYAFVTFHQSYGYEEFVEGIKPVLTKGSLPSKSEGAGESEQDESKGSEVRYTVEDGIFKKLCTRAKADPDKRYAIVIDEINRGNISKIFGELITLIEPSKRIGAEEYVPVTLPYSGDEFGIPPNLDIYGSMNTADRSLALLDTALRRRFNFVAFYPDASTLKEFNVQDGEVNTEINLAAMLGKINQRIEVLYDRDHAIGHGYFLAECQGHTLQFSSLQKIFKEKIIPLLEEYFFEDNSKNALILGDGTKITASKLRFYNEKSGDFGELFGTQTASSANDLKTTYTLNTDALSNVSSYISIYESDTSSATI